MAKVHPQSTAETRENALYADVTVKAPSPTPTTADFDSIQKKLRQRWELASVLNFLHVFEPVIKSDLKMSAEEIEAALIEPNNTLDQLHIVLLKGVLSPGKSVKSSDWIICLSKTLAAWWPWVAKGNFPLAEAKGKEMSTYKELDSTDRLIILQALCEARADQPDVMSFINDALKDGTELSTFQMDKLADDGKGNMFWYDGNETIGHRLYKEIRISKKNQRVKGKDCILEINCQWETLATNLEEFSKVVDEFSSSGVEMEVALSKSIEANIIPILEKHWKKKQKALRLKQRDQMPAVVFRNPGTTRSCRSQKPIDYRFDDYDRAITQAIQYTNKRKSNEEKHSQHGKRSATTLNESSDSKTNSEGGESNDERNDTGSDDAAYAYSSHEEYDGSDDEKVHTQQQNVHSVRRSKGWRFSTRLMGGTGHTVPENRNLGAKNRLRQRPSLNTAVESEVVADSEDDKSSANMD